MKLSEQRQECLRVRVRNRQRLNAELLLNLQGLKLGGCRFDVCVDHGTDTGGHRVDQRLDEFALTFDLGLSRTECCCGVDSRIQQVFDCVQSRRSILSRSNAQVSDGAKAACSNCRILGRESGQVNFNGTTIGCLSAGGQDQRNAQYGPFTDGFVRVPHCLEYRKFEQDGAPEDNYGVWAADQIEKIILAEGPDTVGGLCLEPVTAGGGVITPPDGYWERVQEICRKYDVLLHIDEVVCGIGRTGEWFGYQHFGIQPDMVTMAKGVASGYAAIACLVTTEEVFNLFKDDASDPLNYFRDISTFGGCTAGPTAAIENMAIIERENLLQNTRDMGQYMLEELEELSDKYDVIGQVRGKGLFLGAELVQDRSTRVPVVEAQIQAVVADCMAQGVIIGATNRSVPGKNNTLCFSPALIAKKDDIDQIIAAVDGAMGRVFGSK